MWEKLRRADIVMTYMYDQGCIRNFIFPDNNGIQLAVAWPRKAGKAGACQLLAGRVRELAQKLVLSLP